MEETTNVAAVKQAKPVTTILFCLWVLAAVLLIQGIIGLVGAIPLVMQALEQANGDMAAYQEIYMQLVTDSPIMTYAQFAASLVTLAVAGIWYYRGYVKKQFAPGHFAKVREQVCKGPALGLILVGSICIYTLAIVLGAAISSLMPDVSEAVNEILSGSLEGDAVIGFITLVILAPISEELIVRGIILQRLKRVFGLVGCMITSAILFGVFHMNPIQGLYVIPMGLFWGYLAYRFDSVLPSVICHMINNLLGVILDKLNPDVNIWVICGLMLITAVAAFFIGKKVTYPEFEIPKSQIISEES